MGVDASMVQSLISNEMKWAERIEMSARDDKLSSLFYHFIGQIGQQVKSTKHRLSFLHYRVWLEIQKKTVNLKRIKKNDGNTFFS